VVRTYNQIINAWFQTVKADPTRSANSIILQYKGTVNHLRRQDALKVVKEMKKAITVIERNKNTDMKKEGKTRVEKALKRAAGFSSPTQKKKLKKKGHTTDSVESIKNTSYKYHRASYDTSDKIEFYPDSSGE